MRVADLKLPLCHRKSKWVAPWELSDFDLSEARRQNYQYFVENNEAVSDEEWQDSIVVGYMMLHVPSSFENGVPGYFHPREFMKAVLYLIKEAWSGAATYELSMPHLLEVPECWEVVSMAREMYSDELEELPKRFIPSYLSWLFDINSFFANASLSDVHAPRMRRMLSAEDRAFLEDVLEPLV